MFELRRLYPEEVPKPPIPKPFNIPHAYLKVLLNLKRKSDIVIKPADKGGKIVIINRDNYVVVGEKLLVDPLSFNA